MKLLQRGNGLLSAPPRATLLGLGGLVLTTLLGFAAVMASGFTQSTFAFNEWLHSMQNPVSLALSKVLDAIDRPTVVAIILLILGVGVALWRGWLPGLGAMVVAGGGWVVIAVVKVLVDEPRPPVVLEPGFEEQALSYPSGHVTFVVALTVAVAAAFAGSRWRWPLVIALAVLSLLTAYTRLYLGVHYPGDVIGGMLGGLSGALLVLGLWNLLIRSLRLGPPRGRRARA